MIMKRDDFIEDDCDEFDELDDLDDIKRADSETPLKAFNVVDITEHFFSPDSPLAEAAKHGGRPYEYRPQQAQMAVAVARAFEEQTNLCVEAPTGIGKSFAYLVPSIPHALNEGLPVVITTETINLQEQLVQKDIPILQHLMKQEFKFALAKGRTNYVCLRRLRFAAGDHRGEYLPFTAMETDVDKVMKWVEKNHDGSRSSLDIKVDNKLWSYICCETGNCAGPKCNFFRGCFYWKARREWDKADIIVANHALFFTDLKIKDAEAQDSNLLPEYSAVVFDEAHTLEDSAANHLGLRLSWAGLYFTLSRLFDPNKAKGLLMRAGKDAIDLRSMVSDILDNASRMFGVIHQILLDKKENILRVRQPGIAPDLISTDLDLLAKKLGEYIKLQDDEDYRTELEAQQSRCSAYALETHQFINMELRDHVYWAELSGSSEQGNIILLAAPLNVNIILQDCLFNKRFPVIVTSATLSVCNRLIYFRNRTGYTGGGEMCLDSPFDYEKQVKLYIPKDIPSPEESNYNESLAGYIKHFLQLTHGKAFVLFTNYSTLKRCAEALETYFSVNDITLLVQGGDKNRTMMLNEFREDTNSVIFGTTSFWTGVDVPGEALSNVIITKLPFSVPTHPLVEARIEKIKECGENAFMAYNLPEAILKLRQGVGRLIRSKSDKGIIAILDNRLIKKRYGSYFLQSIPKCPMEMV